MNPDTRAYRALVIASTLNDALGSRSFDDQLVYVSHALHVIEQASPDATSVVTLRKAVEHLEQMKRNHDERVTAIVATVTEAFYSGGIEIASLDEQLCHKPFAQDEDDTPTCEFDDASV